MEETKKLLKLTIVYDPETQNVGLEFDSAEFKQWNFVGAVCGMAKDLADFNHRMQLGQIMQQKAVEAQQAVQLRNQLKI